MATPFNSRISYTTPLILLYLFLVACSTSDRDTDVVVAEPVVSLAEVFNSGLPVVQIETQDNQPIQDKENWIKAHLTISIDNEGYLSETECEIRGRGNLSWRFDKKPYSLRLCEKSSILGMPKHKRWVLLANYLDRTLIRNSLTMTLGQQLKELSWTPNGKHVEVILNNRYVGNYWLCEKISIDKNRLNISKLSSESVNATDITGGYLLLFDNDYDEPNSFLTRQLLLPVGIKAPGPDECNPIQIEYIQAYVNHVEQLLLAGAFSEVFEKYLDADSFAAFLIIQMLSGNYDFPKPRSVYCYKKQNGKLYAGPLWDFDLSTYSTPEVNGDLALSIWYQRLLKSEVFRQRIKEIWQNQSDQLEAVAHAHINEKFTELSRSEMLNNRLWELKDSNHKTVNNNDETLQFPEAIDRLHSIVNARFKSMDQWIDEL